MDENRQIYTVVQLYILKDTFGNLANQCGWSADPEFLDFTGRS